jgi:iron-sulfur cluster insertion protein
MGLTITQNAAKKIAALAVQQGRAGAALRLSVNGGGCSGFQYAFDFTDAPTAEDSVFEQGGVLVAVDAVSLPFVSGAELDYSEGLEGSRFVVNNPNAASSCGCGTSFSV